MNNEEIIELESIYSREHMASALWRWFAASVPGFGTRTVVSILIVWLVTALPGWDIAIRL